MSAAAQPLPNTKSIRLDLYYARVNLALAALAMVATLPGRPLLLAETLKRTGSYDSIFYGLAAVVTVLGVGAWFVPVPVRGGKDTCK
jgi:hypothetical protein